MCLQCAALPPRPARRPGPHPGTAQARGGVPLRYRLPGLPALGDGAEKAGEQPHTAPATLIK